ncbi:Cas scaffold protein family member 4 [Rhinolophus ferrumequinum]|uniref:Cas scaffold protein family member 4 n=1 Tax=Rhinolophus ferrumequinum TaxID=59479 RepID=A0A671G4M5_RHIFE|nr:Cas scaffold protein family member 4 [Rhinolophus ferrumequinum]
MKGASLKDGAPKTLLARALYDNRADCSEELAFSRGDILTILEQNVPESEGWWKCLLHGRQGLAPANRLQILTEAPADRPCPPSLRGMEEALASSKDTHVPTLLNAPPSGAIYEQMKSWVEGPLPPTIQVYEFPDPPACARIVCEKTVSIPRQALFTIPRPAQASLSAPSSQLYDVPVHSRGPPAIKEPVKQQLYDIPASPRKAGHGAPGGQPSNPSPALHPPWSHQDPEKKIHLSEHCRLYFGALFKAISVFNNSLSHSQPPESFIAQSKLIIMVGQKLVDTLCKETQDRDTRNEVLCRSSHLCSLLKNVALATKHAVLEYPSPTALGHLQAEAQRLEHHTRQFRGTLE